MNKKNLNNNNNINNDVSFVVNYVILHLHLLIFNHHFYPFHIYKKKLNSLYKCYNMSIWSL